MLLIKFKIWRLLNRLLGHGKLNDTIKFERRVQRTSTENIKSKENVYACKVLENMVSVSFSGLKAIYASQADIEMSFIWKYDSFEASRQIHLKINLNSAVRMLSEIRELMELLRGWTRKKIHVRFLLRCQAHASSTVGVDNRCEYLIPINKERK